MILPIDNLYELSFYLIYTLRIQPSEVNNLTVPESNSYIKYYDDLKKREKDLIESSNNNKKSTPSKVKSNRRFRR